MEGNALSVIVHQLEELQQFHEKENSKLCELENKRKEVQKLISEARVVEEELKTTLRNTTLETLLIVKNKAGHTSDCAKLEQELGELLHEQQVQSQQKQKLSDALKKERAVRTKLHESDQQVRAMNLKCIQETPEYSTLQELQKSVSAYTARINELTAKEEEMQKIAHELQEYQEAFKAFALDQREREQSLAAFREALEISHSNTAKAQLRASEFEEGLAMGREDLLATRIATEDVSKLVEEVEGNLAKIGKV